MSHTAQLRFSQRLDAQASTGNLVKLFSTLGGLSRHPADTFVETPAPSVTMRAQSLRFIARTV